jgi:hypothetical protein
LAVGPLCASSGEAANAHMLATRHTPTKTDVTCLVILKSIYIECYFRVRCLAMETAGGAFTVPSIRRR